MTDSATKLVAFYLPQYHPIPENDAWWGNGFTEWRNVAAARPLFRGHDQPHEPADLGYYDLRLPETRQAQAELARSHGIGAFCYYHYWFNGRRILERPFNEVLASGQPDFPFCLCWANENWTRAWDGGSREILLEQVYSEADDEAHFHALLPAWRDPRYLRRDGLPVFLVYAVGRLPDPLRTTTRWRELARAHGLPGLYLLRVESVHEQRTDPRPLGFDAAVQFQPELRTLTEPRWQYYRRRLFEKLGLNPPKRWQQRVFDYQDIVHRALNKPLPPYPAFPGVAPSWDNSARRATGALILRGSEPALYESWLREVIARNAPEFVFINAWNEWAEGCHLEPCLRYGHAYLEATRRALASGPRLQPNRRSGVRRGRNRPFPPLISSPDKDPPGSLTAPPAAQMQPRTATFPVTRRPWIALLVLGVQAVVPATYALDIFKLDPVLNLRFSSGNYADGNLVVNRRFLLAGHDLSGLGWGPGGPCVTLISPRHLVTASHMAPLKDHTVSFLNRDGVIKHYVVESVFYVEHSPGVRTDLAVCRLTAPIPPEDHVGYFPTLRLPTNAGYVGLKVYSFGFHHACGMNTISHCGISDMLPFGQADNIPDNLVFLTEWFQFPGQAQAQGNDSGSPTFVLHHGKLALIGTHSAVNTKQTPYLTVDVLLPGYFTQIKAHLAKDGYEFGNLAQPAPGAK